MDLKWATKKKKKNKKKKKKKKKQVQIQTFVTIVFYSQLINSNLKSGPRLKRQGETKIDVNNKKKSRFKENVEKVKIGIRSTLFL